jgi:hypothetical protein
LKAIINILAKIWAAVSSLLTATNVIGFGVTVASTLAIAGIWLGALGLAYDAISAQLASLSINVFGGFPDGAMWLLNQTFPVRLFFQCTVGLIMFNLTSAPVITTALMATRKLKE